MSVYRIMLLNYKSLDFWQFVNSLYNMELQNFILKKKLLKYKNLLTKLLKKYRNCRNTEICKSIKAKDKTTQISNIFLILGSLFSMIS